MKCEVHPDQDALGMCVSCGRGVCAVCKVNYQGMIHCKQCIEAGRLGGARQPMMPMAPGYPPGYMMPYPYYYYPPQYYRATPNPRGEPDGRLFRTGSFGCVATGVMSILAGVAVVIEGAFFNPYYQPSHVATIITGAIFAVLQLIAAVGFYGYYRNYGPLSGAAAAGALSISGFIYLIFLGAANLDMSYYTLWLYIGAMVLGIGQIVAGGALFDIRKFLDARNLAQLSAAMYIFGGGLMAAFVGIFLIGWVLIGVGNFLLAILLFRSPVPESKAAQPDGMLGLAR